MPDDDDDVALYAQMGCGYTSDWGWLMKDGDGHGKGEAGLRSGNGITGATFFLGNEHECLTMTMYM